MMEPRYLALQSAIEHLRNSVQAFWVELDRRDKISPIEANRLFVHIHDDYWLVNSAMQPYTLQSRAAKGEVGRIEAS
jgi:hypothetical protein